MKMKNILITFGVVIAAFIYPNVTTWLVPLVISIMTLSKFRKIDIAKYIGILSLKPVLMMFLLMLVESSGFLEQIYSLYTYEIVSAVFWIVPELILTVLIVFGFRYMFGTDKLTWQFLIGDTVRWLSIFIISLAPDPFPEPYFYTQLYISVFFLVTFPCLYAMVGFISIRERVLSESSAH
jgi:hypothetical protein